jgi:cytochrome c oxidase subunit II
MRGRLAAAVGIVAAAACDGNQAVLNPAGPQAQSIATLTWWFFGICAAVYAIVIGALVWALARRRDATPTPRGERALAVAIGSGVAVTIVIVVGLTVASVAAGRGLEVPLTPPSLDVDVIGHQWWWEFQYSNENHPDQFVDSPNELHLPLGVPVRIRAMSRDVVHSFWVPNLRGKRDLVPGMVSESWIQVDRAGEYRGQCAEFCGLQHARMAFVVVAESMAAFQQWLSAQRAPAAEPPAGMAKRGHDFFMSGPCVMCHTIRGTTAGSKIGPDLTHVASRHFIGAGTLSNTPEALGRWILDAHAVKPGTQMPPNALTAEELRALVAYIETLK